jgi:hypothetical protein
MFYIVKGSPETYYGNDIPYSKVFKAKKDGYIFFKIWCTAYQAEQLAKLNTVYEIIAIDESNEQVCEKHSEEPKKETSFR